MIGKFSFRFPIINLKVYFCIEIHNQMIRFVKIFTLTIMSHRDKCLLNDSKTDKINYFPNNKYQSY